MRYITPNSLPRICFAHMHQADSYHVLLHKVNHRIEISYLEAGELRLCDTEEHIAQAGDILCNPYLHDLQVDADMPHTHHTVCFALDFDASDAPAPEFYALPPVTHAGERAAECRRLIREIIRIHALYPEDSLRCAGLFLELLNELGNVNRAGAAPAGEFRYVRGAKKYIYEHILSPILQRDIAAHLGITPEYLCSIFKKSEGVSIMHFINTVKLTSIRSLMEKDGLTLTQAAHLYGYADPNYVSRLYKQYFHINITDAVP